MQLPTNKSKNILKIRRNFKNNLGFIGHFLAQDLSKREMVKICHHGKVGLRSFAFDGSLYCFSLLNGKNIGKGYP